jgi:hypothetical protein
MLSVVLRYEWSENRGCPKDTDTLGSLSLRHFTGKLPETICSAFNKSLNKQTWANHWVRGCCPGKMSPGALQDSVWWENRTHVT